MSRFFIIVAMLGMVGCDASAPPRSATEAQVELEVSSFLDSYRAAIESRDTLLLPALYVDDHRFEWLEDGEVRYRSATEVLTSLASLPEGARFQTEYDRTSIRRVGADGAAASMSFRTTIGEGESAYVFAGVVSLMLERGAAGWRVVSGHTSTERPGGR